MGTKKRTSELIFNLQWRNKPDNGGDKSNVIGMYDTPTTTSNFEMFKSYLLKNSGVAGDDVKVTYLTDDGQEWVIDSQEWFEIALSAFRLKARLGDLIYLKLDKISSGRRQMTRKHSNDVETQFDMDSISNNAVEPPEWFLSYMKQFKQEVVDEVTLAVSTNLISNSKEKENVSQVTATSKKFKPESSKRCRKYLVLGDGPLDKELLKTFKSERKLENKLDKLDAKTKKIKDKKQALIKGFERFENELRGNRRCRHDENRVEERLLAETNVTPISIPVSQDDSNIKDDDLEILVDVEEGTSAMNATLVNSSNSGIYEHMMGGEVYLHTWVVVNNGKLPWSSNTELRLTWGSSELVPSVNCLKCPSLQPGEKGTISVRFEVPKKPGTYESYWNFYDKNVRFGSSLSCCIVVEEPLASIIPEEIKLTDRTRVPSKLMMSPKETSECSKPLIPNPPKQNEIQDDNKEIGRVIIFPENPEEKKSITIPILKETKKILLFPNTGSKLKSIEIPLWKDDQSHLKTEIDNNCEERKPSNAEEFDSDRTTVLFEKLSKIHQQCIRQRYCSNIPFCDENKVVIDFPIHDSNLSMRQKTENVTPEEVPSRLFADLTEGLENMHIVGSPSHLDSDSDWESINELRISNKYGIHEQDLIVDFIQVSENKIDETKEHIEKADNKDEINANQDNNNNNDKTVENNNSLRGSVSEISDASSDLSSGYDVLNVPTCEEKEDESSGYVYITVDGNKLPVPKYILRPDFLANAEEAPPPSIILAEDEKVIESKDNPSEDIHNRESSDPKTETNIPDVSHCSAAGSSFSDVTSGRLFIFPHNHPGYEVVNSTSNDNQQNNTVSMTNSNDSQMIYTWAISPTQYSLGDLQNACAMNSSHLRTDPYGPLDQSQPSANRFLNEQESHVRPVPQFEPCSFSQATPSASHSYGVHHPHFMAQQQQTPVEPQYPHVPNFQQTLPKKPRDGPPLFKSETPTAPPQPKTPEASPGAVPVHILPENLVTGAVNVASSAINTARSVINMIVPPKQEPGRWVNGHWVTEKQESLRAKNLVILAEMGFWDADLNATLLARYNDDIAKVVCELIE